MTLPETLPRRVVKLGGSLLDMPDLAERLRSWFVQKSPAETLLIVGGGALADAIRAAHRRQPIADDVAHWLCIRAMAVQAALVRALLPEAGWIESVGALVSQTAMNRLALVDPWRFMREDEPRLPGCRLPASWDITSDSIAARLAACVEASELVLLKSSPPPAVSIAQLVAAGYVDRFFPQAASGLEHIRCVNLRDESAVASIVGGVTKQQASTVASA